ncbi:MAG: HAD family hydrolase [Clostridium sp.]|nr:HAD family hydrolase [Clostridium sp.]
MSTKYVFLDIDGTLVGADGRVPDSTMKAIIQARKNGHKIFICSGRCRCEMHENILCVPLDGIVGSAGAYVEIDGKVVFHRAMTEEMNVRLLDYFLTRGMAILLETNRELYGNDVAIRYMQENADYCEANGLPYDKLLYDLVQPLADVQEPAKLAVNKLIYITKKYDPEEVRRDLGKEFTVVDSAIDMPGNSGEVSEIGMHKGVGIETAIRYYGADMADTIGIGDGENDMGMLQACAVGIAMGNANPILKEIADYETSAVEEDGIKNAFMHYGLI